MIPVARRLECAAILLLAASAVSGCDTLRSAAGQGKDAPDEFAIVTKAPLIIPPDYNLRPPKPGEAPLNQLEPTDAAEQSLFGTDSATGTKALPSDMSAEERTLLAGAGVQNTDPTIRQDLATDFNKEEQAASDDFTNQVLFWQKPTLKDEGLNPDAAMKERQAQAAQGTGASAMDSSPTHVSASGAAAFDSHDTSSATIKKSGKSDDKRGGWFDWF